MKPELRLQENVSSETGFASLILTVITVKYVPFSQKNFSEREKVEYFAVDTNIIVYRKDHSNN